MRIAEDSCCLSNQPQDLAKVHLKGLLLQREEDKEHPLTTFSVLCASLGTTLHDLNSQQL